MGKYSNGFVKAPLLGRLAIKNSLITEQEFDEAMNACSDASDPEETLKDYFLSNNLITPQNLKRIITATKAIVLRQKDIKFGTIAVNKGFISQSVVDLVLEEQDQSFKTKKNPRLIGDMLVEAGIIKIEQRNFILKIQNRLIKDIKRDYSNTDNNSDALKSKEKNTTKNDENQKSIPSTSTFEIIKHGIKLEITQDTLTALISKTEDFDDNINPEDIRDLLIKKGITFGLVNNDLLLGFIKSRGFKQKGFIASKGIKPLSGKNAKIEYFFDTDHLKAGGLSASGRIDFKDRGMIPQVEKGTVLSEKIPLKESSSGKNVFDIELATNKAQDMKLRHGKGTKLSEDRLKILAAVNGYPKLTWAGLVVVNQEYITTGDVNYQTGHIKYDGNIKIKGCIKDGFEVRGNDISAQEIQGGIVHSEGNINIVNGVNEAVIYAKGNVYAKFVHNSKIVCMGNVYITKEVVDSQIETSGACITKDGKIISCKITAKMGVFAKQIGTELSEPNIIRTGRDVFVNKELAAIKNKISTFIKETNKETKKLENLIDKNKEYHKNTTRLADIQEKSQANQKRINSKIDSIIENTRDKKETGILKNTLNTLKSEENKINKKLETCFGKIDDLEKRIKSIEDSLSETQQSIDDLRNEKKHLSEWSDANQGDTTIKVTGIIFPGTVVQGKFSEKQIKEKIVNSKIKELMYQKDDDKKRGRQYEMIIA
ncbi:MAG: DUF342 domain-containing protein [Desulfobacterales bacterium]|nr:DUF342 domain-containing protein [Desulfobacterales bacterium]